MIVPVVLLLSEFLLKSSRNLLVFVWKFSDDETCWPGLTSALYSIQLFICTIVCICMACLVSVSKCNV